MKVLQTSALPLGYAALKSKAQPPEAAAGTKTQMEQKTRFELATLALARRCSTAELLLLKMVPQARIELATRGFSVRCSTD
jgi:hypothetical protein